jgi:preprotein translocase subunit SecE
MSRLQKKKSSIEKKKRSVLSEDQTLPQKEASGFLKSKTASGPTSLKAKQDKSPGEFKDPNFIQKSVEFLREVKVELNKVTWPTRKQTTGTTIVVIIFVFVVAAFLGLFDLGLSKLVQVVLT